MSSHETLRGVVLQKVRGKEFEHEAEQTDHCIAQGRHDFGSIVTMNCAFILTQCQSAFYPRIHESTSV